MDVRVIFWGILMHVQLLYNISEFLYFFLEFCDPRGPLGGLQGPRGGAPPRGYPTWVPPSNNLNIPRFWNILKQLFRHNKQKKWDRPNLGGPPGLRTPPKHPPNWLGPPQGSIGPVFFARCV